jgi:NADPH:quinone reductase
VRALGEGVAGFEIGEPLSPCRLTAARGGYASIFVSDAGFVTSMKDAGLDPALAVAVVPKAATAHLAVTQTARMRDGERVLVHGPSEAWPSASPASHAS